MSPESAHLKIILTRLEALKAAIVARDWSDVEFQYDRVLRATTKAEAEQRGADEAAARAFKGRHTP